LRLTMANTSGFNSFTTPIPGFEYTLDIPLSGEYLSFFDKGNEDEEMTPYERAKIKFYEDARKDQKYFRSKEYLDDMYNRADDIQAKQMARAQKYGKESAFYGFMYQGLPSLMAQAAFSRYAFAPEMVKGVQDAYSRMDLAGAVKPSGRQTYMTVNTMGGIG